MDIDKAEKLKEEQGKDDLDEVLEKYEKLYEKETKHQHEIKVNNNYSL